MKVLKSYNSNLPSAFRQSSKVLQIRPPSSEGWTFCLLISLFSGFGFAARSPPITRQEKGRTARESGTDGSPPLPDVHHDTPGRSPSPSGPPHHLTFPARPRAAIRRAAASELTAVAPTIKRENTSQEKHLLPVMTEASDSNSWTPCESSTRMVGARNPAMSCSCCRSFAAPSPSLCHIPHLDARKGNTTIHDFGTRGQA